MVRIKTSPARAGAELVLREIRLLEDMIESKDATIRALVAQNRILKGPTDEEIEARVEAAAAERVEQVKASVQRQLDDGFEAVRVLTEQGVQMRTRVRSSLRGIQDLPASRMMSAADVATMLEEILGQ